jgi:hypothetical protein
MFGDAGRKEVATMGRNAIVPAVVVLLLAGSFAGAADCGLSNAGFEDDGQINDITVVSPSGWDVNFPAGKFRGYVSSGWATEGRYSLTLYSNWFVAFTAGDTAIVSQEVILDATERVNFDVKLSTLGFTRWDPNVCTAVVLVDDDVVWESDFGVADIRGEYLDQTFAVDAKYRDSEPHRLGVGLRMRATGSPNEKYASSWDSIECVPVGPGGDFNSDGLVDVHDLMSMAAMWLRKVPSDSPYNLSTFDDAEDFTGRVNFYDLAIFSQRWRTADLVQE